MTVHNDEALTQTRHPERMAERRSEQSCSVFLPVPLRHRVVALSDSLFGVFGLSVRCSPEQLYKLPPHDQTCAAVGAGGATSHADRFGVLKGGSRWPHSVLALVVRPFLALNGVRRTVR